MIEKMDGALALAVHRGDQNAVDRLVSTYQDIVFSYAYRQVQNYFDAQEVTQDTFIRAYHALNDQYDEERCRTLSMKPWLLQITRNLASNRRRTRHRAREGLPPVPEDLASTAQTADQVVETSVLRNRLKKVLNQLEKSSRELIVLRFIEEMSYAEIVTVVGTSESAVRGKVFRALQKLRSLLSAEEDNHVV